MDGQVYLLRSRSLPIRQRQHNLNLCLQFFTSGRNVRPASHVPVCQNARRCVGRPRRAACGVERRMRGSVHVPPRHLTGQHTRVVTASLLLYSIYNHQNGATGGAAQEQEASQLDQACKSSEREGEKKRNEMGEVVVATPEAMMTGGASAKGPVVVTGASGFLGSWLVMKLLQAGYTVRATVRNPGE